MSIHKTRQSISRSIILSILVSVILPACQVLEPENITYPFAISIYKNNTTLYLNEPTTFTFSASNVHGNVTASLSDNTNYELTSYEYDQEKGTGSFVLTYISDKDGQKEVVITFTDQETRDSYRAQIIATLHGGTRIIHFDDGTKVKEFDFYEFERYFDIKLNAAFHGLDIIIPEECTDYLKVDRTVVEKDSTTTIRFHLLTNKTDETRNIDIRITAPAPKDTLTIRFSQKGEKEPDSMYNGLSILYHSTNGDNWEDRKYWLSVSPYCKWSHLYANSIDDIYYGTDNVWKLDLYGAGLVGAIPEEFWTISKCFSFIDLSFNDLSGTKLTSSLWHDGLEFFRAIETNMGCDFPEGIEKAINLQTIDMTNCGLVGELDPDIWSLPDLETLNIGGNGLSISISPNVGHLKKLIDLNLACNTVVGGIPDQICECTSLKHLDMSYCELECPLPKDIGKLVNLEQIGFINSQLIGEIPESFYYLTKLWEVAICSSGFTSADLKQRNRLTGTLSPKIGKLINLVTLNLMGNDIEGTIPDEIGKCTKIRSISLQYNHLTGSVPDSILNFESIRNKEKNYETSLGSLYMMRKKGTDIPSLSDWLNLGNRITDDWVYYLSISDKLKEYFALEDSI